MTDIDPWLAHLPLLTPAMREQVQAAFRQGLVQGPFPLLLLDLDGRVVAANAAAQQLSGYDESALHSTLATDLAHEDDRDVARQGLLELQAGASEVRVEARWVRSDGRAVWCRGHALRVVDEITADSFFLVLVEDLTEERFSQRQGQVLVEVGHLIATGAPLAVVAERLAGLAEERWSGVGCTFSHLDRTGDTLSLLAHGRLPAEIGPALGPIPVGPDGAACGNAVWREERVAIADLASDPRAERFRDVLARFGLVSGWQVPVVDPVGQTVGAFGLFHPVRREPTAQDWAALESLAGLLGVAVYADAERRRRRQRDDDLRVDALTGLPNQVAVLESIRAEHGPGVPLSVAVLRLGIGEVASALGDQTASQLVTRVAERARALHGVSVVGLTGPRTLAVVARGEWSVREAELLRRVAARPMHVAGMTLRVDVGIGLSTTAQDEDVQPEALLRQATLAVPSSGVARYDVDQTHVRAAQYSFASEIARALREDELVVHYQPQYDLSTGRPVASEALVRWQHPDLGLLFPGAFLGAVALAGAGSDLALHVARRVLADTDERAARGLHGKVAINLTAEDVVQEAVLEALCDEDRRPWEVLDIELTETSLVEPRAVVALERLASHGYAISLDDFGTGYSSLSALHTLPLSAVKIDRSFVQRLPEDLSAEALVGAVASMCGRLDIAVVAEGIETDAQAAAARRLGCATGQGYLFRRPAPLSDQDGRPVRVVRSSPVGTDSSSGVDPAALARAQALSAQGASPHTVAAALNREGHRTPSGARWLAGSVSALLRESD